MSNIDDALKLSELKSGCIKAFEYFFMKYYKPLCYKAFLTLNNMREAEELVQCVLIQVWQKKQYAHIEQSVGGFFLQLVHEKCVSLKKNKSSADKTTHHSLAVITEKNNSPSLTQEERRRQLLDVLHHLPTEQLESMVCNDEQLRLRSI
jgi:DNA-directed RNA polymerase specialized sigma24 family protein